MIKKFVCLLLHLLLMGCATSRNVTLGHLKPVKAMKTAALVPQEGNSEEMSSIVRGRLMTYGLMPKVDLPAATRQTPDVDLIVNLSRLPSIPHPCRKISLMHRIS